MNNENGNNDATAVAVLMTLQTPSIDEFCKNIVMGIQKDNPAAYMILVVKTPAVKSTKDSPLSYESVEWMARCSFDGLFKEIRSLKECNDPEKWCKDLDALLPENCTIYELDDLCLHSRKYEENSGKHPIVVLSTGLDEHERMLRETVDTETQNFDYRRGAQAALNSQYDSVYPTVDCVIFSDDSLSHMYMVKKPDEKRWRFVGGFSDPSDTSYSCAARREAKEETGMECVCFDWIGSTKIDDWRYRNERNKIITNIFAMKVVSGEAKADDDVSEIELKNIDELTFDDIQPEHIPIFEKVKHYVAKYKHLQLYWY